MSNCSSCKSSTFFTTKKAWKFRNLTIREQIKVHGEKIRCAISDRQALCASRLSREVSEHRILCVSTTAGLPVGNRDAGVVLMERILS